MGFKSAFQVRMSSLSDATLVDVLEAIACFYNEEQPEKGCYPSLETIMNISRKSKPSVRTAIKTLCDMGLISFNQENGERRYYELHLERLPAKTTHLEEGQKIVPVKECTRSTSEPGQNFDRVKKPLETGSKSLPGGGQKVDPEGVKKFTPNRESNREFNREGNREVVLHATSACEQATLDLPDQMVTTPKEVDTLDPPVAEKSSRKRSTSTCPFNSGDEIPEDYREIAIKAGIANPQLVFNSFVDHAIAHDRRLVNWKAGFRMWCGNEIKWHPEQNKLTEKPLGQRTFDDYSDWL